MKPPGLVALISVTLVLSLLAGCGQSDGEVIDVFAASSLTNAFTEISERFEAENPTIEVRLNFAGSSTLREQLTDGADAEIFASANPAIMDELVALGAVTGAVRVFATNELVVAVPTENVAGVVGLADLARPELFVGVCSLGVPCGDLADELLRQSGVAASIDTFEPNVRSLTNRLLDGELDVALIYVSDVAAAGGELAAIDGASSISATYVLAAIDASDETARSFVDFVTSAAGRSILASWGFGAS